MPSPSSTFVSLVIRGLNRRKNLEPVAAVRRDIARQTARPAAHTPPRALMKASRISTEMFQNVLCYRIRPGGATANLRQVLYLHGGSYLAEVTLFHWTTIARLAKAAPAEFIVPIYPLAPKSTAAETVQTMTNLAKQLIGNATLTIMGDSAGGGMALAVSQQLRDQGCQPSRIILISPWLDVSMENPAIETLAQDDVMLAAPGLVEAGRQYSGDLAITDPRVSPINGELAGLAPITMFCGTADILNADAHALLARAESVDVTVEYHELPGGQHVYPLLPTREGAEARRAIAEILGRTG